MPSPPVPDPDDRSSAVVSVGDQIGAESITRAILDGAPDGMLLVDDHGAIAYANGQAEALFGFGPHGLDGVRVEQLMAPELAERHVRLREGFQEHPMVRPMGARAALYGLRADGRSFPVEISLSPVTMGEQTYVIAAVRDISERLEIEAELARAQSVALVAADRERIAHSLHDTVIQRLFAAGMALQAVTGRIDDDEVRQRTASVVEQLDDTIREVRSTIFSIQIDRRTTTGLRAELLDIVAEIAPVLGFEPQVSFGGAVESVPDDVAEHLRAALREALSNVARHAQATSTICHIEAGDEVLLRVTDDGIGFDGPRAGGHGVANLGERSAGLGGSCTVGRAATGGTEVVWRVPLR